MQAGDIQPDYCPVSQAIDLVGDRWTLGVVFHVLLGRNRFVDLADAMPRLPRATLSKRLKLLVQADVLERVVSDGGRVTYQPTEAGRELWAVLNELGVWGERWIRELVTDDAVDPAKIMWDIRRKLDVERMPAERTVVHFQFLEVPADRTHFWIVLDDQAPDLCMVDPGFGDDLVVRSRPGPIGSWWIGDRSLAELVGEGDVEILGPPRLSRQLPGWLGTSRFASVTHPPARPRTGPARPSGTTPPTRSQALR